MRPDLSAFGSQHTKGTCCNGIRRGGIGIFDDSFEIGEDFSVVQNWSVLIIEHVEPVYDELEKM